jgi:hypothetical protein
MENFETSLVNYLCPICTDVAEQCIILNSLLTEEAAKEVAELNGKAVGFADHACDECAKHKDAIYLIGMDPDKSEGYTLSTIYRSGKIVAVKRDTEFAKRLVEQGYVQTLKDGVSYSFIEDSIIDLIGKQTGLWNTKK